MPQYLPGPTGVNSPGVAPDGLRGQYLRKASDIDFDTEWADVNVTSGGGGTGITDGDKGDITVSSNGSVWTVDNNVITYAKMQDVSTTGRILGRSSAGAGDIEEISIGPGLTFSGGTLTAGGNLDYGLITGSVTGTLDYGSVL